MLGDGIVSFGTAVVVVDARNSNASAKMGCSQADPTVDSQGRGGELHGALVVLELDDQVLLGGADAAELVDEVHVPRAAAQLTVRGRLEADVLLHPHDGSDGFVLVGPQLLRRDPSGRRVAARLEELGGT